MIRYVLSGNPEDDLYTIQSIYDDTINSGDSELLSRTALMFLEMYTQKQYKQQYKSPLYNSYIRYTIDVVNKTHDIKLLQTNLTKVYYILKNALRDKLKIKQDKQDAIRNSLDYKIRTIKTKPIITHMDNDERGFEVWDVDEQRIERDRKKKPSKSIRHKPKKIVKKCKCTRK